MICAFCGNDCSIKDCKQVILSRVTTPLIKAYETLDWQCNECKEKGINTTSIGQRIRNQQDEEEVKYVREKIDDNKSSN